MQTESTKRETGLEISAGKLGSKQNIQKYVELGYFDQINNRDFDWMALDNFKRKFSVSLDDRARLLGGFNVH